MRNANCRRGTSTSHLRPSEPSRRRMPALATHISAPNLLCAPTTSISTNLQSGGTLNRYIEGFGQQHERIRQAYVSQSMLSPPRQAADHGTWKLTLMELELELNIGGNAHGFAIYTLAVAH